jgi:hypothetical protein
MFRRAGLIVVLASAVLLQMPPKGQSAEQAAANKGRSSTAVSSVGRQASDLDQHVDRLIKRMLNRRTEQAAFSDIEALGCSAVPAIIARMDDRRRLPDPESSCGTRTRAHSKEYVITVRSRLWMRWQRS